MRPEQGEVKLRRKCLNVGSGVNYRPSTEAEDWLNVDMNPATSPDMVCRAEELAEKLEGDWFDEVHLVHVWEHCDDLMKVMESIWAVMKPGGKLVVVCPYWTAENAFADPTHRHVITRVTYGFLSYPIYEANAKKGTSMSQLFPKCDFDVVKMAGVPQSKDEQFKDREFAAKHYLNVIEELQVELECVKPIRTFDIKVYQNRGSSPETSRPGA